MVQNGAKKGQKIFPISTSPKKKVISPISTFKKTKKKKREKKKEKKEKISKTIHKYPRTKEKYRDFFFRAAGAIFFLVQQYPQKNSKNKQKKNTTKKFLYPETNVANKNPPEIKKNPKENFFDVFFWASEFCCGGAVAGAHIC